MKIKWLSVSQFRAMSVEAESVIVHQPQQEIHACYSTGQACIGRHYYYWMCVEGLWTFKMTPMLRKMYLRGYTTGVEHSHNVQKEL